MKKLTFLAAGSLILVMLVSGATGFASLSDLVGDGTSYDGDSALAAASGSDNITAAPVVVGPTANYATAGAKIFIEDGVYNVFSFNPGSSTGILAGRILPTTNLSLDKQGTRLEGDQGFYVIVYFLGTNASGRNAFQINVYDQGGTLKDDGFIFFR